jgi:hypothetical protein
MGILSLIYSDISDYIRGQSEKTPLNFHYRSAETLNFSDSHLPEELKLRINQWIEDIVDIIRFDPSTILVNKTINCIEHNEQIYIF